MNRSRFLSRSRFASLALIGALASAGACQSKEPVKPTPAPAKQANEPAKPDAVQTPAPTGAVENPVDSPAIAETGEVVASIQLPSGSAVTDLSAVLDGLQPGASTILKMQLPAALKDAAGFDIAALAKIDGPISFVILDPTSHPQPLALLIEAKDAAAFGEAAKAAGHAVEQRGDLFLIGPADVVEAGKEFAFTNLTKYPDHSEIIIYPRRLVASFAGMIDGAIAAVTASIPGQGEALATMLRAYAEGLTAVGEQTDRLVLSVSASPGRVELIGRTYAIAGSTFAQFIAAQTPTDHALLHKLPAGASMMVMSGNFVAGPARAGLVEFSTKIMGPMTGGLSPDEWGSLMALWLDNLDGRFAITMSMAIEPGKPMTMELRGLMGASDTATLWAGWRAMLAKMAAAPAYEIMGMKITATHELAVLTHDGIEIDSYTSKIDASGLPPEQAAAMAAAGSTSQAMHLAAFDDYAVMATADAEGRAVRSVIDGARGKADNIEISAALTSALDASKARGDSMLMFMDMASLVPANAGAPAPQMPFQAMGMTVGTQDQALETRVMLFK